MARRKVHFVKVGHVPSRNDDAARVRIFFQLSHNLLDLVDVSAIVVGPRAPLIAVNVSEIAILVGPLIPNAHTILLKVVHVGVAIEKP